MMQKIHEILFWPWRPTAKTKLFKSVEPFRIHSIEVLEDL